MIQSYTGQIFKSSLMDSIQAVAIVIIVSQYKGFFVVYNAVTFSQLTVSPLYQ
jgi:hypothetical protein